MERAGTLDEELVELAEEVARRLGADRGHWTLDLMFEDGRLAKARRHHGPIGRNELREIDRAGSLGST